MTSHFRRGQPGRLFLAWIAALWAAGVLNAEAAVNGDRLPKMPPPILKEGRLARGVIDLDSADRCASFQLRVDSPAYAVRLAMQDSGADLDMRVYDSRGNLVWSAETGAFNERLLLYRLGNPALEDGTYMVQVGWFQDFRPSSHGVALSRVEFGLTADQVKVSSPASLPIGKTQRDILEPAGAMMLAYQVAVPAGVTQVRVDAWSGSADIDLFAQVRQGFADPRAVDLVSQTYRPRESLVIPIPAATAPSKVFLMVVSEPDDVPQDCQVIVSAGASVPAQLAALPVFPSPSPGLPASEAALESAVLATVELVSENGGGSACVISPDGWIVTNNHVVQGGAGAAPERVSVGFSLNPRQPPDCQFWARVVAADRARDLALLKIETGFYGQALPAGYRFPYLGLRQGPPPRLGEALTMLGYPTIGGLGNRATITMTDGKVAGFQDRGFATLIKTAAEISAGNSGGAALDGHYRLVGLPTVVAGDETSRIAFIYPVDLMPAEWYRLAGLGAPGQAR